VSFAAQCLLFSEPALGGPEQLLEQRGGAVLVGVGQGRAARRMGDSHMHQSPQTTPQTVADLAQRVSTSELAKQHGDELRPAGKALNSTLGGVLFHQCGKLSPREVLEQLIE